MRYSAHRITNRDIVYIALFAAVMAVLGLVPKIPLPFIPVPITLQSLGVMLAGSILGAKRGSLAIGVFLLLVAAGMPLLAGGRGGLGVFFGPSGGFLLSFPIGAWVTGWLTERYWQQLTVGKAFLAAAAGGIGAVYLLGVPFLAIAASSQAALGAIAFLPGDLLKAVIAAMAAVAVKRAYPLIQTRSL